MQYLISFAVSMTLFTLVYIVGWLVFSFIVWEFLSLPYSCNPNKPDVCKIVGGLFRIYLLIAVIFSLMFAYEES